MIYNILYFVIFSVGWVISSLTQERAIKKLPSFIHGQARKNRIKSNNSLIYYALVISSFSMLIIVIKIKLLVWIGLGILIVFILLEIAKMLGIRDYFKSEKPEDIDLYKVLVFPIYMTILCLIVSFFVYLMQMKIIQN